MGRSRAHHSNFNIVSHVGRIMLIRHHRMAECIIGSRALALMDCSRALDSDRNVVFHGTGGYIERTIAGCRR